MVDSMYIFVGNLPGEARLVELQEFLGNHEMSVDFSTHRHQSIHSKDPHFLLIKTRDNESAKDLIKELNGKKFHNVQIEARRFIRRMHQKQWDGEERRQYQLDLELLFAGK